MPPSAERRLLQAAVATGALVPVLAGLAGILLGPRFADSAAVADLALDSHFRYLSGLLLGVGLAFWSTVPGIERHGARFRLLTLIVVIGGLARLGALTAGVPPIPMLAGLTMELIATPLLCLWQARVANAFHGN
ncbi:MULTISPECIES: DUF4345 domain-containing protein [Rhodomicrobium]|uniref:DUF4345 domain-containing protein n=1 Tax=Rhodomicrobium TaxID=1068 RepID=UPI000B4B5001|nr:MULTISPECIES: DUF4345 domain-containing protein [Rhodomicrobium]